MGRLEKIVVYTVLFLVAIILGVSLQTDSPEGANGPLARDRTGVRRKGENTLAQAPENAGRETPAAGGGQPLGVMNASVPTGTTAQTGSPAVNPTPNGAAQTPPATAPSTSGPSTGGPSTGGPSMGGPATAPTNGAAVPGVTPSTPVQPSPAQNNYVVSRDGLEPTSSEDFMLYTWKAGDSYRALAQRIYGSPLHVARLRAANEGRDESLITEGEKIMVSVQPAIVAGVARTEKRATEPNSGTLTAEGTYTVKAGDALGTISKDVYGTAKHWKKIYDANKDVIGDDANKLKVGVKLRIPQI